MLNTLYPPTTSVPPTRQLTSNVLENQRNTFFRYITAVEKNGKHVLKNLENQGKGPHDDNGWTAVRESVDKYLRTANGVIEECLAITGPDSLDPDSQEYRRSDRRADSGVSFAVGDRPSTSSSRSSSVANKPLPASPPVQAPPSPKKKGTTLEKIARELRNLRARSDPNKSALAPSDADKPKTVKRVKSTSSIRDASQLKHTRADSGDHNGLAPTFDMEDRRQQLILEAQRRKENRVLAPPITSKSAHELP